MRRYVRNLIVLYSLLVLIKVFISYFIKSPMMFADDYFYMKSALHFFENFGFPKLNIDSYPPLYSIVLSIAYLFKDMRIVFFAMKVINAILSSLIIIPVWLFAREFLTEKRALWVTILASLLPISFSFTPYILSENLYLPLFLMSLYLIYKSFLNKGYVYDYLAGFFIGLSYLTRVTGVLLIAIAGIMFVVQLIKKDFKQIKKKIFLFLMSFIVIFPWLIRNVLVHKNLTGYGLAITTFEKQFSILQFFIKTGYGITYLILASFIILSIISLMFILKRTDEKDKILSLCLISTVVTHLLMFGLYHSNAYRIIGRYLEPIVILFLITSFVGISRGYLRNVKELIKYLVPIQILFLASFALLKEQLYPVNNISLTWLGGLKIILGSLTSYNLWILVGILFLLPLAVFLFKNLKTNQFFGLLLTGLIFLNIAVYGAGIFNYNYNWENLDQTQIGFYINNNDLPDSTYLFDERDLEEWDKRDESWVQGEFDKKIRSIKTVGYWVRGEIIDGDVENPGDADYIISTYELDLPIEKEEDNVYMYRNN